MKYYEVTVSQYGSFTVASDDNILSAGQAVGFGFPNACRNGNCERCMGILTHGSVTHVRTGAITHATDSKATSVLFCVARPLENCEIKVPNITAPGQFPIVTKACQIMAIKPLNNHISQVFLRLPAGQAVQWHAGQYLNLVIDEQEYSFSIASAPQGRDLELHVRHGDDNSSALLIMDYLNSNSTVKVTLPMGDRHLGIFHPDKPLWLICGSTGFAQAKAVIEGAIANNYQGPIHLFWGARIQSDLYLDEIAQQWADENVITYTKVLSDEVVMGLQHGLVHEAVLATKRPIEPPQCLIAGSPAMAWAVYDALTADGFNSQLLHSDVFDYAPRS